MAIGGSGRCGRGLGRVSRSGLLGAGATAGRALVAGSQAVVRPSGNNRRHRTTPINTGKTQLMGIFARYRVSWAFVP